MKKDLINKLSDWRRTHFSHHITPAIEGKSITIFGYIASIRRQGGITFILIEDRSGLTQVTINSKEAPPEILSTIEELKRHSIIGIKGIVKAFSKAPRGAEIIPQSLKILSIPTQDPPFDVFDKEVPNLEKRFDLRAVDLRRPKIKALFRIRNTVIHSIRELLHQSGFLEINTPKLISSATEGGSELFPILYYDKEGFLAQSPQLYKEQLASVFEKVYEIGPIFRAEKFRTQRHLSESISVDIEEAFVDYHDSMNLLEQIICTIITKVKERNSSDIEILNISVNKPTTPFPRLTYQEVLEELKKQNNQIKWGDDLSSHIKETGKNRLEYYFITDWPTKTKAFYIKPKDESPEISEGFDLFYGSLELASGGTRIQSRELLEKRLEEKGLNRNSFKFHLRVFDYSIPPHAGFGLGLERLLMALTGQQNIREVTFFPRDTTRLTP